jgi:hypothetical protein
MFAKSTIHPGNFSENGIRFELVETPAGFPRVAKRRRRAKEKALSRTSGMNVLEKSDYAVVPVNRLNKEEQSSAEVGEGRAWIVENIPRVTCSRLRAGISICQTRGECAAD